MGCDFLDAPDWTSVSFANATVASVPGATVFAPAATGVRMAGAGGALGETRGCITAVGWFTPGGAFVVRFASGGLHAASAAVLAATISAVDMFIRSPVIRCDAPGPSNSRRSSVLGYRSARGSGWVEGCLAFHCRKHPTHAQQLQAAGFPAAIRQGARTAVRQGKRLLCTHIWSAFPRHGNCGNLLCPGTAHGRRVSHESSGGLQCSITQSFFLSLR